MHLFGLSIIELRYSKFPLLSPNAASTLFVLSVLGMFTKLRTWLPKATRKPQKFLIFLIELALILYGTDLIVRQIWVPSLKLLNLCCHFLGQYVLRANQNFLLYNAPQLSSWIRNDAFYITRFLLALITFLFTINLSGFLEVLKTTEIGGGSNNIVDLTNHENRFDCNVYSNSLRSSQNIEHIQQKSFNVDDLPCVPQEDILNFARRVCPTQRKQKFARKNKRKTKVFLDDDSSEYNC